MFTDANWYGTDDDNERAMKVVYPVSEPVPDLTSQTSFDYLTLVHPDTGLEVTFLPGEGLPRWAFEAVQEREAAAVPAPPGRAKGRRSISAQRHESGPSVA